MFPSNGVEVLLNSHRFRIDEKLVSLLCWEFHQCAILNYLSIRDFQKMNSELVLGNQFHGFCSHIFHVPFYEYSQSLCRSLIWSNNSKQAEFFPFSAFAISSSPYDVVRDLISITTKPISLECLSFWASASNRIDSNVSGQLRIR